MAVIIDEKPETSTISLHVSDDIMRISIGDEYAVADYYATKAKAIAMAEALLTWAAGDATDQSLNQE